MFAFKVSCKATVIRFPFTFTSGASNCGGDTTTFSVGLSSVTNSLNRMVTFLLFTSSEPFAGDVPSIFGGVSSYQPPSGLPILAHENTVSKSRLNIPAFQLFFFMLCMFITLVILLIYVHCQHLVYILATVR